MTKTFQRHVSLFYVGLVGGLAFGLFALWSVGGLGQTPTPAATTPAGVKEGVGAVQAAQPLSLPKGGEAPVKAPLVAIVGAPSDLSFEGVVMEGYGRRVTAGGREVGQMVWSQVSKTVNGAERAVPLDAAWSSQLIMNNPAVPAGQRVEAKGDLPALVKAVRMLGDVQPEAKKDEKEPEKKPPADNIAKSGGGRASPSSGNDLASNYQPLPMTAATPETVTKIATTSMVTSAGCDLRIDASQGVAIVQTKEITSTESGTQESACSDSEVRYTLQKSYARCADKLDLNARKAWPQFVSYYMDAGGSTHDIGECKPDLEKEFTISEDKSGCSVTNDMNAMKAYENAALVYTNLNNTKVEVRGCEAVSSTAVPIAWTSSGCSIRHDFAAKRSVLMEKATYSLNGVTYTAQDCVDRDVFYPHETLAEVNGTALCEMLPNVQTLKVYPQVRTRINVNGNYQWITDCTPNETQGSDLVSTHDGCGWVHDVPANISYEERRHYYLKGTTRMYVNLCAAGAISFPHQIEGGDVNGWINHDPELYAQEKTSVYIDTPYGRVDVAPATVKEGTPQTPYIYLREDLARTGNSTYEGCNAWRERARSAIYERPDKTEYPKVLGTATPEGPFDVCISTVIASASKNAGYWGKTSGGCQLWCGDTPCSGNIEVTGNWWTTVNKLEIKNHETGQVVGTTCSFVTNSTPATTDDWQGWTQNSQSSCGGGIGSYDTQSLWVGSEAPAHGQPACPF